MTRIRIAWLVLMACVSIGQPALAQDVPAEYQQALTALGKQGDFKDGVLKVNIPRNDVHVTVAGVKTPTPFGFGGWVAMTKGTGSMEVLMGDLVLLQDEVNPVMTALLDNGLEVTALHNHFFWDEPHMFYMHVHGHGTRIRSGGEAEAGDRSDRPRGRRPRTVGAAPCRGGARRWTRPGSRRSSASRASRAAPSTRSRSAATI